ncbi:hypothetical protein [Micromonospora fulviviridis]|uniref:Uncharacterized protein n=1 Tax=Micromonospora fulviviridis TaxID=47860 RepID=A0ABV2VKM4_9ACTN
MGRETQQRIAGPAPTMTVDVDVADQLETGDIVQVLGTTACTSMRPPPRSRAGSGGHAWRVPGPS